MPLQNRVTPRGEILALAARGTFMGNRGGPLHNEQREIVRQYASRRWITCLLEFKGRHRIVMSPRRYTDLFFSTKRSRLRLATGRVRNVDENGSTLSKQRGGLTA